MSSIYIEGEGWVLRGGVPQGSATVEIVGYPLLANVEGFDGSSLE